MKNFIEHNGYFYSKKSITGFRPYDKADEVKDEDGNPKKKILYYLDLSGSIEGNKRIIMFETQKAREAFMEVIDTYLSPPPIGDDIFDDTLSKISKTILDIQDDMESKVSKRQKERDKLQEANYKFLANAVSTSLKEIANMLQEAIKVFKPAEAKK